MLGFWACNSICACLYIMLLLQAWHGSHLCSRLPVYADLHYVGVELASECEVSIDTQMELQSDLTSR